MSTAEPKVFISYRREETAGHAGRLYDVMAERLGEANVFMDVDMAPGVDFVNSISEAVGACHVLLVIIGPEWATVANGGGPRIGQPGDFVRLEVETALRRPDVTVIPVLVAGARMPDPATLPEDLRPLARRNAIELSDTRWRYDVQRLVETLNGLLPESEPPRAAPTPGPAAREAAATGANWGLVGGTVLVAAAAGFVGRGAAELLRPDHVHGKSGRIVDVVVWRGATWAVIGAILAVWLVTRLKAPGRGRFLAAGALLGALAGAGGAAIFALPRYLPATRPATDVLHLLSVAEFAFTGAVVGSLLGRIWDRRTSLGLAAGLVAGVVYELLVIASGWSVNSTSERIAKVCLDSAVIAGSVAAVLAVAAARQATARSSGALSPPGPMGAQAGHRIVR